MTTTPALRRKPSNPVKFSSASPRT
jgi:hypothetical protein